MNDIHIIKRIINRSIEGDIISNVPQHVKLDQRHGHIRNLLELIRPHITNAKYVMFNKIDHDVTYEIQKDTANAIIIFGSHIILKRAPNDKTIIPRRSLIYNLFKHKLIISKLSPKKSGFILRIWF